jgi:hypothetical protein
MSTTTFTIPKQFCGPPGSSNGGYFCGTVASFFDYSVSIRLKAPPPLDTEMHIQRNSEQALVLAGKQVIAQVKRSDDPIEPAPFISFDSAAQCSEEGLAGSLINHPFPECFVCGPNRTSGDGMRIFTGPDKNQSLHAASWNAHPAWSSDGCEVDIPFIWSALDCPSSGPAFATSIQPDSDIAYVLGTLDIRVISRPKINETYAVVCAVDEGDERLYRTRVSLYANDSTLLATGAAIWVQVPRSLFNNTPG